MTVTRKNMGASHISGPFYVAGVEVVNANGEIVADIKAPAGSIGASELATPLDLSSHSVTLAAGEISAGELASTLDLSGKTLTLSTSQITKSVAAESYNVMDDDSAATNGTPLYAVTERYSSEPVFLASEQAGAQTTSVTDANSQTTAIVRHMILDDQTIQIKDDDNAASNGVALYLRLDPNDPRRGHFEFVSPTNVDGTFNLKSDVGTVLVLDNDSAATGSMQVYFDEDGVGDTRLLVNNPVGQNTYVWTGQRWIEVLHDASASTNGVAVYIDEDSADPDTDRLQFVSPTDTSGTTDIAHLNGLYAMDGWYATEVYFDEDAATDTDRFLILSASDLYARIVPNRFIKLTKDGTPDVTGVQVFYDDDAAQADEKFLFVSPTDTDGTCQVDRDYTPDETMKG
jgi:hypothetical protein